MSTILEKAFLLGLGTITLVKNEGEALVRDALKRNNISESESDSILKSVVQEGENTKKYLEDAVTEIIKTRGASLMPGYQRIKELEARVAALEAKLAEK